MKNLRRWICPYRMLACIAPHLPWRAVGSFGHRWVHRSPAIASSLTDHQWTPLELFNFKVPPPPWQPHKQRGRPSTAMLLLAQQWAA
jgi:hypothetical protein